jgi:hypothetical protein
LTRWPSPRADPQLPTARTPLPGTQLNSGIARATVRSAATSIEGVPAEFAGYIAQSIRRVGLNNLHAAITVLGMGCEGGLVGFELNDGGATGRFCTAWERCSEYRPSWLAHLPRPDHPLDGWEVVSDQFGEEWGRRRFLGRVENQRQLRSALAELLLAAQSVLGVLPPWLWCLQVAPPLPDALVGHNGHRWVNLYQLGNGGLTTPPAPPKFVGCSEVGYIAHVSGECDWHTPCDGLIGCYTNTPTLLEPCPGCAGAQMLLRRPASEQR